MNWNVYLKEHHVTPSGEDQFWKFLCVVFDHEALGIIERVFQGQGLELHVVKVSPPGEA